MSYFDDDSEWKSYPDAVKEILFLFAILPGMHTPRSVAEYIRIVTGRIVSADGLRIGIHRLWEDDYIDKWDNLNNKHAFMDVKYKYCGDLDWDDLCEIGHLATTSKWWPARSLITGEEWMNWVKNDRSLRSADKDDSFQVWRGFELMRAIIGCDKRMKFDLSDDAENPVASVYWLVFDWLCRECMCSAGTIFHGATSSAQNSVLHRLIEYSFLIRGKANDITFLCDRFLNLNNDKKGIDSLFMSVCAYCVWAGAEKVFNSLASHSTVGGTAAQFRDVCADLFAGKFDAAAEKYLAIEKSLHEEEVSDVSTPVALIGLVLAVREKMIRGEQDSEALSRFDRAVTELMRKVDDGKCYPGSGSVANFKDAIGMRNKLVRSIVNGMFDEREKSKNDAEEEMTRASEWLDAGYATVASVLLPNVRRMGMKYSEVRGMEEMVRRMGAVEILKDVRQFNTWEEALESLSACLPKKRTVVPQEKTVSKLKGTIGWYLHLDYRNINDDKCFECTEIAPIYRSVRASEDGKDDKLLTARGLANPKYQECMTEADAEILKAMQRKGLNGRYDGIRVFPEDVLKLLSGHSFVRATVATKTSSEKNCPVTIEYRSCDVTTTEGKDGELILSLPDGLVSALPYQKPTLVRTGAATFTYFAMKKKETEIAEVFSENGVNGKITIPKSGIDKVKDVLERLAGCMPVAGSFACGVNADVERVAGLTETHIRLDYNEEELTIDLAVEPMAENAVPSSAPGEGLAERLVRLRTGKTILLTRDLKAEDAAAQIVRDALSRFEEWSLGKNKWSIDKADSSLDALRILKELQGVKVEWLRGEKIRISAPSANGFNITASGTDWFELKGNVIFDDGRVIELMKLLRELTKREGNYVRFGENDFLYLSKELLRRMEALASVMTTGGKGGTRNRIVPAALPMLMKEFKDDDDSLPHLPLLLKQKAEAIRSTGARPIEVPRRLSASLRYYQETGFKWLEQLAENGFGACLADDMGLGKTIQIISLLLNRAANGASLVVAPASVCVNWVREIERFAPTLHTVTVWDEKTLPAELGAGDVVVSSYGILVSRDEEFVAREWNGVILDEAQAVKNANTQRAQIACRLNAKFRVAATGTPVENRLLEFWSIFSFLNPGLLGTQKEFTERFTDGGFATKSLKRIVEPFVMRRLKRDVLEDLPEKIEVVKHVALNKEELHAYEALRRMAVEDLQNSGEADNRISILAALTRLRRFCCHPSLVLPEMTNSSKLDAVMDLLEELRDGGHRALIFSQFVDYLAIVRKAVKARGWSCCYLDGATSTKDRSAAVDAFQRGEGDFFLISLKAGGTGLNLTAANDVVLLDPWWNPAVEDQAADRAHRIGQKLPVTVHRIVAEGTVEDRILNMHADKRAVSEDMLDAAKGSVLTPERLMSLLNEI